MLKIKIKASDITNLTDARYFAAKEVEWLCFNFVEGATSYIDPMKARAIVEWVDVPQIVGEFGNMSADEINLYTEGVSLQGILVGNKVSVDTIKGIRNQLIIKDIWIEKLTNFDYLLHELSIFAPYVEAFQLSFDKEGITWQDLNGSNALLNLADLSALCEEFPIILSIDFEQSDLNHILSLSLYGLNVKGGEEERVGVKSFDDLDEIFEALEIVESE